MGDLLGKPGCYWKRLVRPVGGAHPVVCVWVLTSMVLTHQCSDRDNTVKEYRHLEKTLIQSPGSLWTPKSPGCPSEKNRGLSSILAKFAHWPLSIMGP